MDDAVQSASALVQQASTLLANGASADTMASLLHTPTLWSISVMTSLVAAGGLRGGVRSYFILRSIFSLFLQTRTSDASYGNCSVSSEVSRSVFGNEG